MGDRRPWAIADTAESAVADDEHFASLAMFMKVSAHVGDRGFNFEYANGVLKVSVFRRTSESRTPKYRTVPTAVASYSLIHSHSTRELLWIKL
eukprot:scaffold75916_cov53-Phaeocystis_antarctica.AAC.1